MFKQKKGISLSINALVIIILAVIVLIVLLLIFSSAMRQFASDILIKLKNAIGLWNATGVNP